MNGTPKSAYASELGDLLAQLPLNQSNQWTEIEATAQHLADDLRVKDVEQQTALGKTLLPQTITSLLKGAINGACIPSPTCKPAIHEILRVGANLCRDHDENRGYLLEAGFPQTVVSLLEGYAESIQPNQAVPLPLSIPDLNVVRTSIGLLLNASISYEPVKFRLISLEAAMTILKLAMAIYPPGSWSRPQQLFTDGISHESDAATLESWNLRSSLSSWAWRVISELRGDAEDDPQAQSLFGPDALPFLVRPLSAFIPPYPSLPLLFSNPSVRHAFVQGDFDVLNEVCGLLESLCMDVEDVRLSLARGLVFPDREHSGVACLSDMLSFVGEGEYPPYWHLESPGERSTMEKRFTICKGAVIKAVVEVAGEEKNMSTLWDDSDTQRPGGVFVDRMVRWIRTHKGLKETHRDDLIICATLSLGNLVRRDALSMALVNPPISLSADLAALLEPDTDIKVKHGIVGLLKHLAQPQGNRAVLGQAGIIQKLASSQVWGEKSDIAVIVQGSAIGVVKHLCNGNAENSIVTILPDGSNRSAMEQILTLTSRSDEIAVKSEGTRVLVNVIKSLWSSDRSSLDAERRRSAVNAVLTPKCTSALARLVGRSKRYPVLINEGVVALSLLSTDPHGATLVLDAIMNPLPSEVILQPQSQPMSAATSEGSPTGGPRRALDMLITILKDADQSMPFEMRANVCAVLAHLGRKGAIGEERASDVARMKDSTREYLESAASGSDGSALLVSSAAKRVLEAWA
ncbi:hypothetical protein BKA93DRAFT_760564 [Sparassis latifolia]|uniref:ARM repeat-containing protein n=1 Tax=Sparassis crispa TaxID=139825 RepID=A0A401GJI9_9APHY|nr:predicted protein [Sparassis crispa]GBE82337.1 predicted protein [Sparassis crispa]